MSSTRRVLITGANGFLGRYIADAWRRSGAEVTSLGRSPANDIVCDLSKGPLDLSHLSFDTIIHAAGKAHSHPRNESQADEFFRTNVDGTRNLLHSLDQIGAKTIVYISSVAVYGLEEGIGIDESAPLTGNSPYAKSKIAAEVLIKEWAEEHNAAWFNLRLPLVVGADPPGNLGRMMAAIRRGTYVRIRDNQARKSLVSAVDVANLTLGLKENSGVYNLTDRTDPKIFEIEDAIALTCGGRIYLSLPGSLVKIVSKLANKGEITQKLTSTLTFSSELAVRRLGWDPSAALSVYLANGSTR